MCNNKEVQEQVNTSVYRIVGIDSSSDWVIRMIGLFRRMGKGTQMVCMGILVGSCGLGWMGMSWLIGGMLVIVGIWQGYKRKIREMKIVCGVGETNSDFFRSDLLKKIKTTPPYAIFEDKKIK